jgi:hypothetical protein
MCVCAPCVSSASRSQKRVSGSLETGVPGGCKPPHGCWESNFSLLYGQQMFLIAEPWDITSEKVKYTLLIAHSENVDKDIPMYTFSYHNPGKDYFYCPNICICDSTQAVPFIFLGSGIQGTQPHFICKEFIKNRIIQCVLPVYLDYFGLEPSQWIRFSFMLTYDSWYWTVYDIGSFSSFLWFICSDVCPIVIMLFLSNYRIVTVHYMFGCWSIFTAMWYEHFHSCVSLLLS